MCEKAARNCDIICDAMVNESAGTNARTTARNRNVNRDEEMRMKLSGGLVKEKRIQRGERSVAKVQVFTKIANIRAIQCARG